MTLDQVAKGDFFVQLVDGGDFWVKVDDLRAMGFQQLDGTHRSMDGEDYLSLQSMPGVSYDFNQESLTLVIHADPSLLPSKVLDLKPERRRDVIYPHDNSLFLNYGLDYSAGGEGLNYRGLTLSNELGARYHDWLFLTNTLYSDTSDSRQFIRYMSNLTHDRRDRMQRLVIGDFFASSGDLGSRLNLGGVSFSKVYRIDPYFIRYPLFDFSGLVSQPSQVDMFVDGVRIRSEHFAPGEFELRNFQGFGGAQTVEIEIRDALGRVRRMAVPFYFSDQVLRRGLQEYSYNLGFLRSEFGLSSNRYTKPAFSGYHRFGVTNWFNLGLRGEAGDGVANLGVQTWWKTGLLGLLHFEAAGSHAPGTDGAAGLFSYDYQNRRFRGRLALQGFSPGYRSLGDLSALSRKKLNLLAGIGYATPTYGSWAFDLSSATTYHGENREVVTLSWARRLWRQVYTNLSLRRNLDVRNSYEANLTLTWYLGEDTSLSAAVSRENGDHSQVLEARKNTPIGQGTGWNLRTEHSSGGSGDQYQLNAQVQQNATHGILRGDFSLGRSEILSTEDLKLSLAGALVHIGDRYALTRPVNDSFAMVSVGKAEGVGVSVNGQLSGRTDSQGRMIVPELSSYYENQISIEDKDIPLDFLMPRVRLFLSPPLRSGACINFPLQKYQAFTGTLLTSADRGKAPLANTELTLETPSGPLTFWTGESGEFYFDSQQVELDQVRQQGCSALLTQTEAVLPAGDYPLAIHLGKQTLHFKLTIPAGSGALADLGEVVLPAPSGIDGTPVPLEKTPAPDNPASSQGPPSRSEINGGSEHRLVIPSQPVPAPPVPSGPVAVSPAPSRAGSPPKSRPGSGRVVLAVIHFPFDRAQPVPADLPGLAAAAAFLRGHTGAQLSIEGYTDLKGSSSYNLKLGQRRADAVRRYLLDAGVPPGEIGNLVSYGERDPICRRRTEECLRQNRRAVLVLEQNGLS